MIKTFKGKDTEKISGVNFHVGYPMTSNV